MHKSKGKKGISLGKARNSKSSLSKTNVVNDSVLQRVNGYFKTREAVIDATDKKNGFRLSTVEDSKSLCNRAKKMKETLDKLELTNKLIPGLAFNQKKTLLLNFFQEIIDLEPHFGYILNKIKCLYEESTSKLATIESEKANLLKTNKQVNKKIIELEQLNKSLKLENDKLKNELVNTQAKVFKAKTEMTELMKVNISQKLVEELEELYKENKYLLQLTSSLKSALRKSQMREHALVALVQDKKEQINDILNQIDKKFNVIIEVGKNKVKVPKLDLSTIQCNISCESSEEKLQLENDNAMQICFNK